MIPHALDNPIWASLSTRHRALALGRDGVLRYPATIAPFIGISAPGAVDGGVLADLVGQDETVFLVGLAPEAPVGWTVTSLEPLVQMMCTGVVPAAGGPQPVALGKEHLGAVLELTALVYPHYFRGRTMELGRYFGIFEDDRLAAMAGERMGMPGYREISAVCTHPDFVGRGYARTLLVHLANDIRAGDEVPFLQVSPANARAIRLYEQNGFQVRATLGFWSLKRSGA